MQKVPEEILELLKCNLPVRSAYETILYVYFSPNIYFNAGMVIIKNSDKFASPLLLWYFSERQ